MREPVTVEDELRVVYRPLGECVKFPANPKEHDLGAIISSISRFGFRDPITVNLGNENFIEEGHGRLDALVELKRQHRPVPRFVKVRADGEWLVPTLPQQDDEVTQRGYMLAHNRTQELGGGYVDELLYGELLFQAGHGQLAGTGFDGDDIDALAKKLNEESSSVPTNVGAKYQVVIECDGEEHQAELIERFQQENLRVRALIS